MLRLIHHKFNPTTVPTASAVAKIDPLAENVCIKNEFNSSFIKKPIVKLTNANLCSLIPCKMADVTVNNAKNNATGAYHVSKEPVSERSSIPYNDPYVS